MAGGRALDAGGVRRSDSDGDLALDDAVSRTYRLFFSRRTGRGRFLRLIYHSVSVPIKPDWLRPREPMEIKRLALFSSGCAKGKGVCDTISAVSTQPRRGRVAWSGGYV